MNDTESVLARAPRAALYLEQLAKRAMKRPLGSHSGAFVRNLGLTDDEVKLPSGKRVTATEAKAILGAEWYLSAQFTGRERITPQGREELAKLKPKA